MTREEIIQGLYRGDSKAIKEAIKILEQEPCEDDRKTMETYDLAIKALEQQEEQEEQEDAIRHEEKVRMQLAKICNY